MSTEEALKVLDEMEDYVDVNWDDEVLIDRIHKAVGLVSAALKEQEIVGTVNLKGEAYYITGGRK